MTEPTRRYEENPEETAPENPSNATQLAPGLVVETSGSKETNRTRESNQTNESKETKTENEDVTETEEY